MMNQQDCLDQRLGDAGIHKGRLEVTPRYCIIGRGDIQGQVQTAIEFEAGATQTFAVDVVGVLLDQPANIGAMTDNPFKGLAKRAASHIGELRDGGQVGGHRGLEAARKDRCQKLGLKRQKRDGPKVRRSLQRLARLG